MGKDYLAITELMKQYFSNRDRKKQIKIERVKYLSANACHNKGKSDGISVRYTGCIEDDLPRYCPVCLKRNEYYLTLKKLTYKNIGIIRKVRNLVK